MHASCLRPVEALMHPFAAVGRARLFPQVVLGLCAVVWAGPVKAQVDPAARPVAAVAPAASAASAASAAAAEAASEAAASDPVFEPARRSVRSTTEWLASGIDSWFGDKSFAEGGKVSDGRLSVFLLTRQHEKPDFTVRFNARVWLPNLEDRAYLFLGRDDAREAVTDKPDAFSRQQGLRRDNGAVPSFFAGLGYLVKDAVQFRLGFRGGLKPYAHARYGTTWQPDDINQIDFRETVFWTLDDHFGSTTALSFEHAFSPDLAVRWLSSATITQDSKRFEWTSGLGAYRSFGDQQQLSLELVLNGLEGTGVPVNDIGVQAKWEQPVHKDWLIGEVLIGHFWPRPDALSTRSRAWAFGAGLRMKF